MELKIFTIIIVLMVLVQSGCVTKVPLNQQDQQVIILDESWVENTVNRLEMSRGIDGGYSDFPPETPDLYSTYYFLASLDLLNKEPEHKQATIDWLLSIENEMLAEGEDKNPSMIDLYYLAISLDILGAESTNKSRLISKVMELQMPDGSFSEEKGRIGTISDTFRAIVILDSLGVDIESIPLTKEWVISNSRETEENIDLNSLLSDEYRLVSTLKLYEMDKSTLKEYEYHVDLIKENKELLELQVISLSENQIDLFTLDRCIELLAIVGGITPEILSNVSSYLKEKQVHDGGFNAFTNEYGESHGTYLAMKIASNIGLKFNDDIESFIYRHELSEGGFRPAWRQISSHGNTYLIVLSLQFLGSEPCDKDKLFRYLENEWEKDKKNSRDVYHLLMTYKILDNKPPFQKQAEIWVKKELDGVDYSNKPLDELNLRELYYLTKLAKLLDVELDNKEELISNIQSIQNDDGGFGFEKSDTYTTFLFVGILSALGNHPKDQDGCIFWIKQGQISDGGFIFRRDGNPTNNSEMYSTYISVVSLYNMNAEPDDVEGLLKWLMDCKEATGGFRLAPQYSKLEASPGSLEARPEYTGWGLITLDIIQQGP